MKSIITLDKAAVQKLYKERMLKDFPEEELAQLSLVLDAIDEGYGKCYALAEDDEILAYALFGHFGEYSFFDYCAVREDLRGQGVGSVLLKMLREELAAAEIIFGEVIDPECADSEEERKIRTRRLDFYIRDGFINTGIKVKIFGVDYVLVDMVIRDPIPTEEIREMYESLYRAFLSEEEFKENVIFK